MMKKLIALCLTAAVAVTMFAACGKGSAETANEETGGAQSTEGAAQSSTDEDVTIKVATWEEATNEALTAVKEAFEEENPNIKVEFIDIPGDDFTDKLTTMFNGNADFDAAYIKDAKSVGSLKGKGQILDLTPYIEKDGVELEAYQGKADYYNYDGEVVALPVRADHMVLFYNKDIFDAAGVDYPSNDMTWAEFEALAADLTSGEGSSKTYGALFHTWSSLVTNWAYADGNYSMVSDNHDALKPYYEMLLRMQEEGSIMDYAGLKTSAIGYAGPFQNGYIGMLPMGTWTIRSMIDATANGETDVNWGIARLPHSEDNAPGSTTGSVTPIAINAASDKVDAVWEYVKFITGGEGAKVYASYGTMPGMATDEIMEAFTSAEGMPEGVSEGLSYDYFYMDDPTAMEKIAEYSTIVDEEHDMIMLGESSIEEGIENMNRRSAAIK